MIAVLLAASAHVPPNLGDSYGAAVAGIGDVDGDAVSDWVASDAWGPGVLEMRSGKTGRLIWSIASPSGQVGFAQSLCAVGDWNGDDIADVAAACSPAAEGGTDVFVLSGKDGAMIFALPRRDAEDWSDVIAGGFDIDGDTAPDLVLGRVRYRGGETSSSLEAWSGKGRERLWESRGSASRWLGEPAAAGIDFTVDGIADVVAVSRRVAAKTLSQEVVLLSGRDGAQVEAWDRTASRATVAIDVSSGKGRAPRILVASTAAPGSGNIARIDALERGRADAVWSLELPGTKGDIDIALCTRHDLDGDGVADIVVGQRMANMYSGRVDAYSGEKGEELWALENGSGEDFGFTVRAHPDLDGDGVGDFLVSAACPYNSMGQGAVVAVSGRNGRELYRVGRATPRGSSGR